MEANHRVDNRLLLLLVGVQGIAMLIAAFVLPENFQHMPLIHDLCNFANAWMPNVRLMAAKSQSPDLIEAFIVIAAALALLHFVVYVIYRPPSKFGKPIDSWAVKILGPLMFGMLIVVCSAFYWNPAVSDMEIGLLKGRGGAYMYLALSGRLGLGLVGNFMFCLGPFVFLCAFWILITKRVRKTVDFRIDHHQRVGGKR